MECINTQSEKIYILRYDDVRHLHTLLSQNYTLLENMDAVEPPGVKSHDLLESAVQRQFTGTGTWYKYETCYKNCATLIFGIIKNHSFYNGNKRTGLLAMIKHLYINGYVLKPSLKHQDIYNFIIAISDDSLKEYALKNKDYKKWIRMRNLQKHKQLSIDEQINFISYWLKFNSISKKVEIKGNVKMSTLKSILERKGIKVIQNGTKILVYKELESKFLGIKTGTRRSKEREYTLGNTLTEISKPILASLRRDFNLTPHDGVDNVVFYDDASFLDEEITIYRSIIYKLSRT